MKNWFKVIFINIVFLSSATLFADDDHEKAKRLVETGEILPLEVILKKVREIQPGKVLEVELETKRDIKIYEIELLNPDGVVLELKFNAKSGQHLSTEKED